MCELLIRGIILTGLPVVVVSDGPHDRKPARSPGPGIAAMYATVTGDAADIQACIQAARDERDAALGDE